MAQFEYKVVPAPLRGIKVRGARTPEDRFAQALQAVMNDLGADGWDYVRCDTLPCEERTGLTGRTTVYRNMLVFRRQVPAHAAAHQAAAAHAAPVAAPPMTLAARMAATLRPGSAAGPAGVPSLTPPAPDGPTDTPVLAPTLGPADRGAPGTAPRLVADRTDPDLARARPDDATAP